MNTINAIVSLSVDPCVVGDIGQLYEVARSTGKQKRRQVPDVIVAPASAYSVY